MKKIASIITVTMLVAAMAISATGCKKQKYINPEPSDVIIADITPTVKGDTEELVEAEVAEESIFTDHDTLAAAVEASGIAFSIPDKIAAFAPIRYSNVDDKYIEVTYQDETADKAEANEIIIRKEPSSTFRDISGDAKEYALTTVMELEGTEVTLRIEDNLCYVAIWYYGDASYAVVSHFGIDTQDMQSIVSDVIEFNRQIPTE